jgi:outer membrane protein assembly factor BamB
MNGFAARGTIVRAWIKGVVLGVGLSCIIQILAVGGPAQAASDWPTHGFDLARTGANPNETVLGVGNVATLKSQWSVTLGGAITAQPIVASHIRTPQGVKDLVIVGDESGRLSAVDAASGALIWAHKTGSVRTFCSDLPRGVFGITASAAFSRRENRVYSMGGDGKVHAYRVGDGEPIPGWPAQIIADPRFEHVYGGLAVYNGGVYAVTASMCDKGEYHGRIVFVDGSTGAATATHAFYVDGTTVNGAEVVQYGPGSGSIWGPGGVSIDKKAGTVLVATGNVDSQHEYDFYGDQVVRLDLALTPLEANYPGLEHPESDVDFGSTAVLFQPYPYCPKSLAAINKDKVFFTYDRSNLSRGPLQRFVNNSHSGDVAYDAANRQLLVTNLDSVQAWRYDPSCTASLAWQTTTDSGVGGEAASPPTVANGVVYYGNGAGGKLEAFDARTGKRLLKLKVGGPVFAAPTVVNGRVYVVDWNGGLHAYAPGP